MQLYRTAIAACLGLALLTVSAPARAQSHLPNLVSNQLGRAPTKAQNRLTNLISNQVGQAPTIDPLLANPWGLARSATGPWWVSDNDTGWATVYNATGTQQSIKVLIPTQGNGPSDPKGLNGPGTPTGIVSNGSTTDFEIQGSPSVFIFATLDGTISAWAPGVNGNQSIIAVDNSASKAMYTGLAITSKPSGNFLYAADNTNNHIDMFDGNFELVKQFGDPSIPSNFSVFGVQDINGLVYVTYAVPNVGAGGFVDVFKEDGTLVKELIRGLPLNQAWGIALAPNNFGPLSNTLLVSNNSVKGTINAFNPKTGEFVGAISEHGKPIVLNNLWAVVFGGGNSNSGPSNELFVTVGQGIGTAELAGTYASIVFNPTHH